ncbi:MAG: nucleotidyl transferase AbiEii/AbiGii toxin family protein [Proteobacteria bacterium]|nr:nucleotidyl transferase AbiEii/AbiGii toxin family protein [Pseudomonadota bacterium]
MPLLHDTEDFTSLIEVVAGEMAVDTALVEKDYWIMHVLWGLQQLGMAFELKGGTSLSKGYGLIDRFSEDIDILIHPTQLVPTGRNHTKPAHIEQRRAFFDGLVPQLTIPGIVEVLRDHAFDNDRLFSAGIRLIYPELTPLPQGVKAGVLLEAGFDQVSPNAPRLISSWAWDRASAASVEDLIDNRAVEVRCYDPGYTLVEKLQTISTKYRRQQASGEMPTNFMRHYYDVYCLLADEQVLSFIGTGAYLDHKRVRFPAGDEPVLRNNPAFALADPATRRRYSEAFDLTRALYYREQPSLEAILARIDTHLDAM